MRGIIACAFFRPAGAGADCTLRSYGFGAKTVGQQDGVPPSASPYPFTTNAWALTIGGLTVQITYCRAAPGLIIDQFNFAYPTAGFPVSGTVAATLQTPASAALVCTLRPGRGMADYERRWSAPRC